MQAEDKACDELLKRCAELGSPEGMYLYAEHLSTTGNVDGAIQYYYWAHLNKHPHASFNCAMECQIKAQKTEENNWYLQSLKFYRYAIITTLLNSSAKDKESELFDCFYNAATVALELEDFALLFFLVAGCMRYSNDQEDMALMLNHIYRNFYEDPSCKVVLPDKNQQGAKFEDKVQSFDNLDFQGLNEEMPIGLAGEHSPDIEQLAGADPAMEA